MRDTPAPRTEVMPAAITATLTCSSRTTDAGALAPAEEVGEHQIKDLAYRKRTGKEGVARVEATCASPQQRQITTQRKPRRGAELKQVPR